MLTVKSCSFTEGYTSKYNRPEELPQKTCFFRVWVFDRDKKQEAQLSAVLLLPENEDEEKESVMTIKSKQFSGDSSNQNDWDWKNLDWTEMVISESFQRRAQKVILQITCNHKEVVQKMNGAGK